MIVFVEETIRRLPPEWQQTLDDAVEAWRLAGATIYSISAEGWINGSAEIPLAHVPHQERPVPALRLGYFGGVESYEAIYAAAVRKNIFLLNTPEQQRTLQDFELAYLTLEGLVPRVLITHSMKETLEAAQKLGFPIFVKEGAWKRVGAYKRPPIAHNVEELQKLCAPLFEPGHRAQGRIVLREEVALRHNHTVLDIPLGREFCLFLFKDEILSCSYLWGEDDPLADLSAQERTEIEELARTAASRLPAPYAAIYIGQQESGEWIVTDTTDPQLSDLRIPVPPTFWRQLIQSVNSL